MKSLVPQEVVEEKILFLRGHKVMLDKDLAALYQVDTRDLNKTVTRNLDRFPSDFMFRLTGREFKNLKFHFGTSSWGGTRKLPHAFTEQGVAMLSNDNSRCKKSFLRKIIVEQKSGANRTLISDQAA